MVTMGLNADEHTERGPVRTEPIDICMRYLSTQLDAGATLRANGTLSNDRAPSFEKWGPPQNTDHTLIHWAK